MGFTTKLCKTCKEEKKLNQFYKQKRGLLGRTGSCKSCRLNYQKEYSKEHLEQKRINGKKWYSKNFDKKRIYNEKWRKENTGYRKRYYEQNKEIVLQANKAWRDRNPDRILCYEIYHEALRQGKIEKRETCSMCGIKSDKIHAHHNDYSKPLDVICICPECHFHIHRKVKIVSLKGKDNV